MLSLSYSDNRQFLLDWNEEFPLDHWWRKKYNVAFNSPQHKCVSHIDMYYDWLEENMFEDYVTNLQREIERRKIYQETGKWLFVDEEKQKEQLIDQFDNLDISAFNVEIKEEPQAEDSQANE